MRKTMQEVPEIQQGARDQKSMTDEAKDLFSTLIFWSSLAKSAFSKNDSQHIHVIFFHMGILIYSQAIKISCDKLET